MYFFDRGFHAAKAKGEGRERRGWIDSLLIPSGQPSLKGLPLDGSERTDVGSLNSDRSSRLGEFGGEEGETDDCRKRTKRSEKKKSSGTRLVCLCRLERRVASGVGWKRRKRKPKVLVGEEGMVCGD